MTRKERLRFEGSGPPGLVVVLVVLLVIAAVVWVSVR